ncbi:MAG: DUF1990 family protein [Ilumatobacteraceae bacterium]
MTQRTHTSSLEGRSFTYLEVGATEVASTTWAGAPIEFRRYERTVAIETAWDDARLLMLQWAVKTRSGFTIDSNDGEAAAAGSSAWLSLSIGPVAVREPIRVVAVVDTPLRCGFSYGTLVGHPVSGEEAFVLHRLSDRDPVSLTIRSLTRPAPNGFWRYAFPLLLVAQRAFRRRYLRSIE